jgi:hypothetical protein
MLTPPINAQIERLLGVFQISGFPQRSTNWTGVSEMDAIQFIREFGLPTMVLVVVGYAGVADMHPGSPAVGGAVAGPSFLVFG